MDMIPNRIRLVVTPRWKRSFRELRGSGALWTWRFNPGRRRLGERIGQPAPRPHTADDSARS